MKTSDRNGIPGAARRGFAWCVLGLSSVHAVHAQKPVFQISDLAPSSQSGWFVNAYPVIDQLPNGTLVCLFSANTKQPHTGSPILVSTSKDDGKSWSEPSVLFEHPGMGDSDPNLVVDGNRILAFSTSVETPNKITLTSVYMRASEDGVHWGSEKQIKTPHRYVVGKIHHGYKLVDGTLIMGYSWDIWAEQKTPARTEGEMIMKSGVLRSKDGGERWNPGADMSIPLAKTTPNATWGVAEPATVVLADGRIMTLMRSGGAKLSQAWSSDGGLTWTQPVDSALTAHNSPAALDRLGKSNEVVAVWDNTPTNDRTPLTIALSGDEGVTWSPAKVIVDTPGFQVSYPTVKYTQAGTILVAWQQALEGGGRKISLARLNRAWISQQ